MQICAYQLYIPVHAVEHRVPCDAGIVDEDVDGADLALDLLQSFDAGLIARHVPFVDGDAGLLLEFGGGIIVAAIIGGDIVAGLFERFADGRADSARAAGDHRRACHCRPLVLLPLKPPSLQKCASAAFDLPHCFVTQMRA